MRYLASKLLIFQIQLQIIILVIQNDEFQQLYQFLKCEVV